MPEDINQFKKLPAEERLQKLKQFKKKREDELSEAQLLIKKSADELQRKKAFEEKIPIPQLASDDEQAFSGEERDIFQAHRQRIQRKEPEAQQRKKEEPLEEVVEKEKPKPAPDQAEYTLPGMRPVREMYQEAAAINQAVEQRGYITRQEMAIIAEIYTETQQKEHAHYKPSTQDKPVAERLHERIERLQGIYRAQKERGDKVKHGYSDEGDDEPTYRR